MKLYLLVLSVLSVCDNPLILTANSVFLLTLEMEVGIFKPCWSSS